MFTVEHNYVNFTIASKYKFYVCYISKIALLKIKRKYVDIHLPQYKISTICLIKTNTQEIIICIFKNK